MEEFIIIRDLPIINKETGISSFEIEGAAGLISHCVMAN
jgi:hypothetical protein